jgi:hypothetical protein
MFKKMAMWLICSRKCFKDATYQLMVVVMMVSGTVRHTHTHTHTQVGC